MDSQTFVALVGWLGTVLLFAIVVRVLWNGVARVYPWFASYVSYVLVTSVVALWLHSAHSNWYALFYWVSQFVSLLLGVAVSFEVLHRCFERHPGIRTVAVAVFRILLLCAVVRVVLTQPASAPAALLINLERDVRVLQAILLMAISILCIYYSISLNRNVIGIVLGYGGFICCSVINLALRSHLGDSFQSAWTLLQPVQYFLCELVWAVCLWSLAPALPAVLNGYEPTEAAAAKLEMNLRRLRSQLNVRRVA